MKKGFVYLRALVLVSMIGLGLLYLFPDFGSAQIDFSPPTSFGPPIETDTYTLSRSKIDREFFRGEIFRDSIIVENLRETEIEISFEVSQNLDDLFEFDSLGLIISPLNTSEMTFLIKGTEIGDYSGDMIISGDIETTIPVNISVVDEKSSQELLIDIELRKKIFRPSEKLDLVVDVQKVLPGAINNVTFTYTLLDEENISHDLGSETMDISGSIELRKTFDFPENSEDGNYLFYAGTEFRNETVIASSEFEVKQSFLATRLFGLLPVWVLFLSLGLIILGAAGFIITRKIIENRKKYKMKLFTKTLPKKSDKALWLGKVAEKNIQAYLEMDRLTTHGIVAGATGGGKSISAQVLIEEALLKNVGVIVFDPTAQWSGMLRKNEDKKMMSYYSKFGLKPSDVKAFPGNVRQIENARQLIDIEKYIEPGQIQIFTLNKLDPSEMDTFVASVIAQIFRSDPKEHPGLRTLLVFDEVHRLLPRFGGKGAGFLQIERACREFRKWGLGVLLVSQVLSDFAAEIKANINTEVQMRTRDEADLDRLKTKFGEEFLQSLIKASIGVGMFVNPAYNRGKPYFINFRPILHSTKRLSDEELDKYNKYGETIEDLEYQIEQLEKEKVDVFDLKMELKLVKDKMMQGNFTVVDIYLEGLRPRIEKQWESIGKKPKKKKIELIEESEVAESVAAAQKEKAKLEKKGESGEEETEEKKSSKKNKKKSSGGRKTPKSRKKTKKKKTSKKRKKVKVKGPAKSRNHGRKKVAHKN